MSSDEPLKSTVKELYMTGLRMHNQFALIEGQKELAEYLKNELELDEPQKR